jgi:hypothetical protein
VGHVIIPFESHKGKGQKAIINEPAPYVVGVPVLKVFCGKQLAIMLPQTQAEGVRIMASRRQRIMETNSQLVHDTRRPAHISVRLGVISLAIAQRLCAQDTTERLDIFDLFKARQKVSKLLVRNR